MIVTIDRCKVDVARRDCGSRACFVLGFDKGSFTPGVGYTSYYAKERPVCMTRHLRGCPHASVCPKCRTAELDGPGAKCGWPGCDGITVEMGSARDGEPAGKIEPATPTREGEGAPSRRHSVERATGFEPATLSLGSPRKGSAR